jgi:hypothetical protein
MQITASVQWYFGAGMIDGEEKGETPVTLILSFSPREKEHAAL